MGFVRLFVKTDTLWWAAVIDEMDVVILRLSIVKSLRDAETAAQLHKMCYKEKI